MNFEEYEKLTIGDKVYKVTDYAIMEYEIVDFREFESVSGIHKEFILNDGRKMPIVRKKSNNLFCNKIQAEEKKRDKEINKLKKQKLYDLEVQLNKEYNINTFIIKY